MAIELYRIDDRLIHGQVVVGWGQPMRAGFIVLVDDTIAGNAWEQELYRMGAPPEVELIFASVDEAARRMAAWRADRRKGILLTADVDSMRRLAERVGGIDAINVGGIHFGPGRAERLRYVYLSPDEEQALQALAARGIAITVQDVPSARAVPLADVLHGGGQA